MSPSVHGRAVLLALLLTAACAVPRAGSLPAGDGARVATTDFAFTRDTFAFRNEIRSRHPDVEDLYANYCFVLARGIRQFFLFARFDPTAPKLTPAAYTERVRELAARPPWHSPPPRDERVVIPGYANLRDFSRAEEAAVKAGLGGPFWTWVHWTNWRVTFPVTPGQQARVAEEIAQELDRGRLVQLLITNLPSWELNHTVVAYAYRRAGAKVALTVWDPNNPDGPGVITFDAAQRRFWATDVYDTEPGPIRVFRMYFSWLL
ncbi:MAG: hypothetical protein ACREJV_01820 [Candidatus Rokuibacteriota bacterium]